VSIALLFPGQGSQFVGMGTDLVQRFPEAADTFAEADEILGYPLSRLVRDGPEEELVLTHHAQPAILVHSVAVHRLIGDVLGRPVVAAGHSLGEFSAHVAAGTLSFPDAVKAVRRRGELMYQAGTARPGTMAALLGLEDGSVRALCQAVSREPASVVVPANLNAPGQVVISGDAAAVERAIAAAPEAGAKRVVPLSVSGAFHSPLMAPAQEALKACLAEVEMRPSRFPVVSNVTARAVTQPEEARELLVRQLTAPVRWAESVSCMLDAGATEFVELGPGSVLTGLSRRNARSVPARPVGTAEEVEAVLAG
jgi:[acyl-carrier-protein] S-malonyltransferase